MFSENTKESFVDFESFHSALQDVKLLPHKGYVLKLSGLTIESRGPSVGLGQLCSINISNGGNIFAEVIGFKERNLILLPLEHAEGVTPGDCVVALNQPRYISLDNSIMGRVLDGLGRPIDGKGSLTGSEKRPLDNMSPPPLSRKMITEPLSLGIRSIDAMLTCGKGQRVGIFSGSGVGKSVLLGEIANSSEADVNVVALVGERG